MDQFQAPFQGRTKMYFPGPPFACICIYLRFLLASHPPLLPSQRPGRRHTQRDSPAQETDTNGPKKRRRKKGFPLPPSPFLRLSEGPILAEGRGRERWEGRGGVSLTERPRYVLSRPSTAGGTRPCMRGLPVSPY